MPLLRIASVLAWVLLAFGLAFLVPIGVAIGRSEGAGWAFVGPMALVLLLGAALLALGQRWRPHRAQELGVRDGILLVGLVWTLLPALAALPLMLYFEGVGRPLSFTRAYFEAMSGLTTTGSTVLVGLDHLPGAINIWRGFLQWLGGMGILVLAVAILPLVGAGGGSLLRAETSGPLKELRLTPRIATTAKGLWSVYAALSLACVLAYRAGGMSWFDAWMHMFTTMSLGGLSNYDASFGHFDSAALEWIAIAFMLLASGSFALYFVAVLKRDPVRIWRNAEWRGTQALMLGAGLAVAAVLVWQGGAAADLETLRRALFNLVSIASTTGYASEDYTLWPAFAPWLMLILSGMATSAGSTGAGIKMARLLLLIQLARHELTRILHPRAVTPITVGGAVVPQAAIQSVLAFMLVYGVTVLGLTLLLLLGGMDFDTAFSAVLASINNMGPGFGEVGPAGNYAGLSDFKLWVCALAMLLGRLEILAFLVLFTRAFWRK
ncbi:TrkH family potassium uptake protein [Serpentinimonas barnesii]|uniref:TrkH family potassium uptake protein n=1 Tax=Serpentinimonas barnesii TaxID=1458427 RepID=UPI0004956284|nr:potassium transporter TrkG [Serpentinimonas barnesii]